MKSVYKDSFNMLCGKMIGSGIDRDVFACKIRDDLVVKVEKADYRNFSNVTEMAFWCEHRHIKAIGRWLAPCEFLSPDGRVMLQRKASPVASMSDLPKNVPSFLADLKIDNFGIIGGKIVCVDYAIYIANPSVKLKKADWV